MQPPLRDAVSFPLAPLTLGMTRPLTYDRLRRLLPDVRTLGPLLDEALRHSRPDPDQVWSGAGELGTAGARLVDRERLATTAEGLADRIRAHTSALHACALRALDAAEAGDAPAATDALLEAAALEEAAGDFDAARRWAAKAVAVATDAPNHPVRGTALRRQARAERALGEFDLALTHYAEAFQIAGALQDQAGAAEAAIGAGNVEESRGRWSDALRWYHQALERLEPLAPSPAHWHAPLNVHIALRSMGAVADSRGWLERASTVAHEVGDPAGRPFLLNAEGQLHMADDAWAQADTVFRDALAVAPSAFASVTIRLNLAEALLAQGRHTDATEEVRRAERDALVGRTHTKLPEVYRLLGRAAAAQGNTDAFVFFEHSLAATAPAKHLAFEHAQTLQAYAAASEGLGFHDDALHLYGRAASAHLALGSTGFRRPWCDCYDVPISVPQTPQGEDA